MDDYLLLGVFTNTHGIKGEIRILSDFDYKEKVFKPGFKIYFGNSKQEFEIVNYRPHKEYDMVTLKGIDNINQIDIFKSSKVYIKRSDLNLQEDEIILHDLIGYKISEENQILGIVEDIVDNNASKLLSINAIKKFYIPYESEFIIRIDKTNKTIYTQNTKGLII